MSQENVEIVQRGYGAFNRGDAEAMVADTAPTFEYVGLGLIPGFPRSFQGPEGWKEAVSWLRDEFDDASVQINDLIGVGDLVLSSVTISGRGKQSGAVTSLDMWLLWTVQGGKVVRGQGFRTKGDALEAAGLSE
jgi:ketosteroid isomerase-like protein